MVAGHHYFISEESIVLRFIRVLEKHLHAYLTPSNKSVLYNFSPKQRYISKENVTMLTGSEKKQSVAATFDKSATTYDTIGPRFFSYFGHRMIDIAGLDADVQVLDVACGRGATLIPASKILKSKGHVTGIDISSAMIEATGKDLIEQGITNASVHVMDAEHLAFSDNTFDCVLGGFCIFFFSDLPKALSEMRRVLKPHGKMVLSTWGKTNNRGWHIPLAKKHLPGYIDGSPPANLFSHSEQFEEPSEVQAQLRKAGFHDIITHIEEKDFFYADEEEWWLAQYSYGIRRVLDAVQRIQGDEGLALFKQDALEHIRQFKSPQGVREALKVLFHVAYQE